MTLLRAAARTMLASYFVASGVKAIRNPEKLVPAAAPMADKVVPLVKQYAPEQVAHYIPEDPATLVRLNGAVEVLGGLALATGKGRRLGALLLAGTIVPSTIGNYPFWSRTDAHEKAVDRSNFLKSISLLGGVLLAAGDTEGKPSLAWRAHKGGELLAKKTSKASDRVAKRAHSLTDGNDFGGKVAKRASQLGDTSSDLAEGALAGGAALVSAVVAGSRRAQKAAVKQAKVATKVAAEQAEVARKQAAAAAKQARKDAPQQLKAARKFAEEQAAAARQAAKQARKDAPQQRKAARKQARKVGKHIELGSN
ncbi:MAG: hypothetical protein JWP61_2777 [Friedmanniella sp.]|nr:hypothetical protein [Friedmanniella sp.]